MQPLQPEAHGFRRVGLRVAAPLLIQGVFALSELQCAREQSVEACLADQWNEYNRELIKCAARYGDRVLPLFTTRSACDHAGDELGPLGRLRRGHTESGPHARQRRASRDFSAGDGDDKNPSSPIIQTSMRTLPGPRNTRANVGYVSRATLLNARSAPRARFSGGAATALRVLVSSSSPQRRHDE